LLASECHRIKNSLLSVVVVPSPPQMEWMVPRKPRWKETKVLLLFQAVLCVATKVRAGSIEEDVRDLIGKHGLEGSRVAVAIITESGKQVVSIHDLEPFQPASNQKVLTTAAGLYFLGPDHAYETTLSAAGALNNGVLQGDLILHGSGEPNISGRFHGG